MMELLTLWFLLLLLLFPIIGSAAICAAIAYKQGRSLWWGIFFGIFFNIIAIIVYLIIGKKEIPVPDTTQFDEGYKTGKEITVRKVIKWIKSNANSYGTLSDSFISDLEKEFGK